MAETNTPDQGAKPSQTPTSGATTGAASAEKPERQPARRARPENEVTTGVHAEIEAVHDARTVVPGRPGVDARLDSRSPEMLEPVPLRHDGPKPQHVDGPDLAGQAEHTRAVLAERKKKGRSR